MEHMVLVSARRRRRHQEGEAGTADSAGQVDKATNSVKIDWRVAWKGLAGDLWQEDTSKGERDPKNYGK